MRLLEPFNGLKLASGHPLFHFAFFFGSLIAVQPQDKDFLYILHHFSLCRDSAASLVVVVRFVHLWVGITSLMRMMMEYYDYYILGRCFKTINLFVFQATILYE